MVLRVSYLSAVDSRAWGHKVGVRGGLTRASHGIARWVRAHRISAIVAVAAALVAGGSGGAYAALSAQHTAAARDAARARTQAQNAEHVLEQDAGNLLVAAQRATALSAALPAVIGQDDYLGASSTTTMQPAAAELTDALGKVVVATSVSPSSVVLRSTIHARETVPAFQSTWSTEQLTAYAKSVTGLVRKISADRAAITELRSGLSGSTAAVAKATAAVGVGLPAAEAGLLAANPLASDADKAALVQALTAAQAPSAAIERLVGYITAAKNLQASHAAAAAAAAQQTSGSGSTSHKSSSGSSGSSSGGGSSTGGGSSSGGYTIDTARHVQTNSYYVPMNQCPHGGAYYYRHDPGPGGTSIVSLTQPWTYAIIGDWIYVYLC